MKVVFIVSKTLFLAGDELEGWFYLEDEPTKTYNVGTKLPGQIRLKLHYPKVFLTVTLTLTYPTFTLTLTLSRILTLARILTFTLTLTLTPHRH